MENNNDMFEFLGEDIYSSTERTSDHFEDIVSDSKMKGRHYSKRKRGNKFTNWWRGLQKWQRVTAVSCTSVVLALAVAVGAFRILFNYNYNDITKIPKIWALKALLTIK